MGIILCPYKQRNLPLLYGMFVVSREVGMMADIFTVIRMIDPYGMYCLGALL